MKTDRLSKIIAAHQDLDTMLDQLTRQDFEGLAAGAITVDHPAGRFGLSVVETRDLPPISPRQSPFAIVLQGPPEPFLAQGTYALSHPGRGTLELFIVPIARDARNAQYEAIFN